MTTWTEAGAELARYLLSIFCLGALVVGIMCVMHDAMEAKEEQRMRRRGRRR